jgi:hypothetical protein
LQISVPKGNLKTGFGELLVSFTGLWSNMLAEEKCLRQLASNNLARFLLSLFIRDIHT